MGWPYGPSHGDFVTLRPREVDGAHLDDQATAIVDLVR
jgi:hypothetical protein